MQGVGREAQQVVVGGGGSGSRQTGQLSLLIEFVHGPAGRSSGSCSANRRAATGGRSVAPGSATVAIQIVQHRDCLMMEGQQLRVGRHLLLLILHLACRLTATFEINCWIGYPICAAFYCLYA